MKNSRANLDYADSRDCDDNEPPMDELTIDELLESFGPEHAFDADQQGSDEDLTDTGTFPAAEFLLSPDELFPDDES